MKILVIHYNDDNFGDVLICNCFKQLLKVVLENLNIKNTEYEINVMGLKNPQLNMVAESQLICFAGGGLFGLSYLNFYESMKDILQTAQDKDIPVIFSSMGVNNMDATKDNENCLYDLLKMSCIKAISVRENKELFESYAGNTPYKIFQVCDPAVWTKYVYAKSIDDILKQKKTSNKKTIGINVVRGGLFVDNDRKWYLTNEVDYLYELMQILQKEGYECKFYTNGSTLDNNTMMFMKNKYNIPEEKCIYIDSTKELVETIAGFDAVAAIRMHSSIICYALDIPAVNLVWNDKIPLFYKAINRPDYAIELENWNADNVFKSLSKLEESKEYYAQDEYLMSLYSFLFNTLTELWDKKSEVTSFKVKEVKSKLQAMELPITDEILDMKLKLLRGKNRYYGQFIKLRKRDEELKKIKGDINKQTKKIKEQEKELEKMKKELEDSKQKAMLLQGKLDSIERKLVVRVYRKVKRLINRVLKILKLKK